MDRTDSWDSRPIRVLITHEVRVFREGLASLLGQWMDLKIVNAISRRDWRKHRGREHAVDVVLLDAGEADAVASKIQEARSAFGGARVIVLGVSEAVNEILACIEAGAAGYTSVDSSPEHLVDAIRMVHLGQTPCPPSISALLFERIAALKSQLQSVQDNRLHKLTPRELEILQLVCDGMSNKGIAAHLNLELQTVKNYVHNILDKLRVRNRREAVACIRSFTPPEAATPARASYTSADV